MRDSPSDRVFSGSVAEIYQAELVPLFFEPYAPLLVQRLPASGLSRVLEIAAGTAVVTRAMAAMLPSSVWIVATDLNRGMLAQAIAVGTSRRVEWAQADAMRLPFVDGAFDAVVCQFGAMFFPDKPAAFAEARRVLRRGGVFAFSVWDGIEDNELADCVTTALREMFPNDPPAFLARTPHGYGDRTRVVRDLAAAGFTEAAQVDTVALRSRADSAEAVARALCAGSPLAQEIERQDRTAMPRSIAASARAIAERFGEGGVDAKMQAHLVTVVR
jgi:SAM-dependent methyltransferase